MVLNLYFKSLANVDGVIWGLSNNEMGSGFPEFCDISIHETCLTSLWKVFHMLGFLDKDSALH